MRVLSGKFIYDLGNSKGMLNPLLTRIKRDHTLMLAIRDGYINIYYRGGNIMKLKEINGGIYRASFDENYNKSKLIIADSPTVISRKDDTEKLIISFADRKNIMDEYFSIYSKAEREFQQLIARENNFSSISNTSEYFISDIEFIDPNLDSRARLDLLAFQWRASQRKTGSQCRAALIEMKYGDGALSGSAGLLKHLEDMDSIIANRSVYAEILCTMESQFNQLDELGLINFNKGASNAKVRLDPMKKPEVIFMFANHNPRSSKLKTILNSPKIDMYANSQRFDLRFYVASFSGYAMHTKNMLELSEFRKML